MYSNWEVLYLNKSHNSNWMITTETYRHDAEYDSMTDNKKLKQSLFISYTLTKK